MTGSIVAATRVRGAAAPARIGQALRLACVFAAIAALAGCSTLTSWIPPPPSFDWLFGGKKIPPLPQYEAKVTPRITWQASIGRAMPGLAPGVTRAAIFAAASDGTIARVNPANGQNAWRVTASSKLAAGVGADLALIAVGNEKGDVFAYDTEGKALWQSRVTSEIYTPPLITESAVIVWSGDGRIYALNAADGKTKWVFSRNNPPLIVRNTAGGVVTRGGVFTGTPGGKLVAIDVATGNVGWEGNVATPKGATELERIADITSLPVIDDRQVCAAAYQGRVACFELVRGTLVWSREVSSLGGIVVDNRYLYITDDKGAVQALDKATGSSVWKQDKLAGRTPTGPQLIGDYVGVVDIEGYLHVLNRDDGSLIGRIATDGSPPTGQPAAYADNAVWLSANGTLYSVGAR